MRKKPDDFIISALQNSQKLTRAFLNGVETELRYHRHSWLCFLPWHRCHRLKRAIPALQKQVTEFGNALSRFAKNDQGRTISIISQILEKTGGPL